jgi:hypothetical protein
MFGKDSILIGSSLVLICCLVALAGDDKKQDQSARWEPLLQTVEGILAGKNPDNGKITIAPGARLIFGRKEERLQDLVSGKITTCSLKEDSSRVSASLVLKVNDSDNAAFLILKTEAEKKADARFHTVVFMKDSSGQWRIESWHTSN